MEDSSVKLEESVLGYEYKMTIEDPYMRMTLRDFGKDGSIDEWYLNCMDKGKICKSIEAGAHNPFMQRRYDYYMKRLNEQGVCHFSCPLKKPK